MNDKSKKLAVSANESRSRGLLLVCVFVFPIAFTAILFFLITTVGGINLKVVEHKTEFANIETPINRSAVSKEFVISGSVDTPLLNHSYYLMERRNSVYWPKYDLGNKPAKWSKEVIHRAKDKGYATYQVVMADLPLQSKINKWFKKAEETGKYPSIGKIEIETIVANIRVNAL